MFISLFTKLQRQKRILILRNIAVKPQHVLFENEPFLPKMPENFCAKKYRFLAPIVVCTLKKIPWKNYVKFWKWNLKRTHQSVKNSCLRKFKVLHYMQHDFIRQHPGLSKDQISMFKSLVSKYFILKYRHTF